MQKKIGFSDLTLEDIIVNVRKILLILSAIEIIVFGIWFFFSTVVPFIIGCLSLGLFLTTGYIRLIIFAPAVFKDLIEADRMIRKLCFSCGYDLRATPDRCPECGTFQPPESFD